MQQGLQVNPQNARDRGMVILLNEIGGRGWHLVAVRDDEFRMHRPAQRSGFLQVH